MEPIQQPITNQTQTPQPAPQFVPPAQAPQGNNKMATVFIAFIIVTLIGAGIYFFLSLQSKQPAQKLTIAPTITKTAIPTPTPDIDQEIESIDTGTPDSEFSSIEQDLQSL